MMDEQSIASMGILNKGHRDSVGRYYYKRFQAIMAPFGLSSDKILNKMARSKAVISGSASLLMLFPGEFKPGDLDIYVPAAKASPFIFSLTVDSGYTLVKDAEKESEPPNYEGSRGISVVHWLKNIALKKTINIIVVPGDNPIVAVMHFGGSHVMTFITPHGFGCAYPDLTLARLSLANPDRQETNHFALWRQKHIVKGFAVETADNLVHPTIALGDHQCTVSPLCPRTIRHLRDAEMMYLTFKRPTKSMHHTLEGYTRNVVWGLNGECRYKGGRAAEGDYKGFVLTRS